MRIVNLVLSLIRKCHSKKLIIPRERDSLDLSFNDYKNAYKSKKTGEVVRALIVYHLCSIPPLVKHNMVLMNTMNKMLGKTIFEWFMRKTFYGHFVVGEDQESIKPTLERMISYNVFPILDYSVEEDIPAKPKQSEGSSSERQLEILTARTYFYTNEATCERNMETFLRCLESVAPYGYGYAAIKMTALGRPSLLFQISDVIIKTRELMMQLVGREGSVISHHLKLPDLVERLQKVGVVEKEQLDNFLSRITCDAEGVVINLFPWSGIIDNNQKLTSAFMVPNLKSGKMEQLISQLTDEEEEKFRNLLRRVTTLAEAAKQLGVSLMVDAEQSYYQPAISRLTMELMRKYNHKRAIILNTYQCYLKNSHQEISLDLEQSERQQFYFGAKIVRGAYLLQERERAKDLNQPDPTNESTAETSLMYHNVLFECMERIKRLLEKGADPHRVTIVVASHNEDTVRFAIEEMIRVGIDPEDHVVSFAQLYGMCDAISFPLGQAGYCAYKYMPYGPVTEVLPYLSRRLHENGGVLKTMKEKALLRKELWRRLLHLQVFSKPKGQYHSTREHRFHRTYEK